jgi:hypothetical protein
MPDRPYICVFCGSRHGARPTYSEAARRVGEALARDGLGLVYGGGRVGLMGVLADAAIATGGRVVGILPEHLSGKEIAHDGLSELHIVPSMHARKAMMAERSRAFLALPGGVGTFEELFEILTWSLLGLHHKPLGLLNVEGYYDTLIAFLDRAVSEDFLRPEHRDLLIVSDDPEAIVSRLASLSATSTGPAWIDVASS